METPRPDDWQPQTPEEELMHDIESAIVDHLITETEGFEVLSAWRRAFLSSSRYED